MASALMLASLAFTSCSDSGKGDDPVTDYTATYKAANEQFVNKTVVPTYKKLADASQQLCATVESMSTQADVNKACTLWKSARQYWEWSEAFLFGAASNYRIDPHIDTWPFDVAKFNNLLLKMHPATDELDRAAIDEIIANTEGLTGFHALEYLIFRDGEPRKISDITPDEAYFAAAVASDLYLSTCRLEAAWAGIENISTAKAELLAEAELEPTENFGQLICSPSMASPYWKTHAAASVQIIEGCLSILDEVASQKIGKPASGEDPSYIESPQSYNSVVDFHDNIEGCLFAYCGGHLATSPATGSLATFIKGQNATLHGEIMAAFTKALTDVSAIKEPFKDHLSDSQVETAIKSISALAEKLTAAEKYIK